MTLSIPSDYLTVTAIKDYVHCPRFVYYAGCLPAVRPRTYMMDAGREEHERERERARRRTLRAYGLPEGERRFAQTVVSHRLRLAGQVDELVIAESGWIPVDYKLSDRPNDSFIMQVTAYALLVEETFGVTVTTGFLYLMVKRTLHPVPITPEARASVERICAAIRRIIDTEQMPPPPSARAKCRVCEFRRFCNDV
jgi:CRISPR-associated exonuclease Cas4